MRPKPSPTPRVVGEAETEPPDGRRRRRGARGSGRIEPAAIAAKAAQSTKSEQAPRRPVEGHAGDRRGRARRDDRALRRRREDRHRARPRRAAEEIAELRRSADEDVAAIRDWSKAEIARIREETESRISGRKAYLEGELEEHAGVDRASRRTIVNAFAPPSRPRWPPSASDCSPRMTPRRSRRWPSSCPSRRASTWPMLERRRPASAPSTPAPSRKPSPSRRRDRRRAGGRRRARGRRGEREVVEATAEARGDPEPETADVVPSRAPRSPRPTPSRRSRRDRRPAHRDAGPEPGLRRRRGRGRDVGRRIRCRAASRRRPNQEIPTIADEVVAARLAGLVPPSEAGEPSERLTTKVVVSGLVSVASIAGFKRDVAPHPGCRVGRRDVRPRWRVRLHGQPPARPSTSRLVIPGLPGFDARVTGDSEDGFVVTARDPEAHD